jgi:S1-C subfamily serine protease
MGAVFNSHPDGAIAVRVWEGLPASAAGISAGDIVTRVNGKSFDSRDTFFVLLADEGLLTGSRVELEVIHANDGTRSSVAIQLK